MAKLYLKFEAAVLKEITLSQGTVTIGRLPDNLLQIDNPAVSGHHAKIYWDTDHYVLEDNNSTNGTYVNNRRVSKAVLQDKDQIMCGKHNIVFEDSWHEDQPAEKTVTAMPAMQKMEATVMLDTKKAREMMAGAMATGGGAGAAPGSGTAAMSAVQQAKDRVGTLTVIDG